MKLRGPNISGVVAALASGDEHNQKNAEKAFDQLFLASASSLYLERRAGDLGITRSPGLGMGDEDFRNYSITKSNNKLTQQAILRNLEVFFGPDRVRGHITSGTEGPYHLQLGDTLQIIIDGQYQFEVAFEPSDFRIMSAATSAEVAIVISKELQKVGSEAYSTTIENPETGTFGVRLYSSTIGPGSSIQVIGGRAQNVLQFPTPLDIAIAPGDIWSVALTETDRVRLTVESHIDTALFDLEVGDRVNIYGANFHASNRGSYEIVEVHIDGTGSGEQYIEIINLQAEEQGTVTILSSQDLFFFRPYVGDTLSSEFRSVLALATKLNLVDVFYPATTRIVGRSPGSASYLLDNVPIPISPSSLTRSLNGTITITTEIPHGLEVGQQVHVRDSRPCIDLPTIIAGEHDAGEDTYTTDVSPLVHWSQVGNSWTDIAIHVPGFSQVGLADGDILVTGGGTSDLVTRISLQEIGSPDYGQPQYEVSYVASTLPSTNRLHATVRMRSGNYPDHILALGGHPGINQFYDPDSDTWSASGLTPILNDRRSPEIASLWSSHHGSWVHLFVGSDLEDDTHNTNEMMIENANDGDGELVSIASVLGHRGAGHRLAVLSDESVLIIGGREVDQSTGNFGDATNRVDRLYGDLTDDVTVGHSQLTYARYNFACTTLPDGRVMVIGGIGRNPSNEAVDRNLSEVEIYDPQLGCWLPCGRLSRPRRGALAAYLPDIDAVMVWGGTDIDSGSSVTLGFVEFYDLKTGQWPMGYDEGALNVRHNKVIDNSIPPIQLANGVIVDIPAQEVVGTGSNRINIFSPGALWRSANPINTEYSVDEIVDDYTISIEGHLPRQYGISRGGNIYPLRSPTKDEEWVGPIVLDPSRGVGLTNVSTTLTEEIAQKTQRESIGVANALEFPDEPGWLIISFGYERATYPIPYLGRRSPTELRIDYRFKFPHTLPIDSEVTLLSQRGPWIPTIPEETGLAYITDSALGRRAAQKTLEQVIAAGVDLQSTIFYPGDIGLGNAGWPEDSVKSSDKYHIWGDTDG